MVGVLGIDAAWTEKEPSGVALLKGSPGDWRCVAIAPSYDSFLVLAEGAPVDWIAKAKGAVPDVSRLVAVAEKLLNDHELAVVTVDMPLSTAPITGRREADAAISRAFGDKGAAVHSPSVERPGIISTKIREGFAAAGFPLATGTTPAGTSRRLVEVYPHPALLSLTGADYRLPYKVSRSRRYWPDSTPAERRANLLIQFQRILSALVEEIRDIPIELPHPASALPVSELKRYEDSLDALICAWVGAKYLEGNAIPYGDHTAAIWVPRGARRGDVPASNMPLWHDERTPPLTDEDPGVERTKLADDFNYFMSCLTRAGSKLDPHYFPINVAGSEEAVFRERVYCYELYHQLRNTLGDNFPYKLDGEIDKVSHRLIEPALGAKKPDFVVHEPGEMNQNLAVVEVKSLIGARADNMSELSKDLDTLRGFLTKAQYHRGVMLVYGDGRGELPPDIATKVEEARTSEDRILLLWHPGPGESPEVILG